MKILFILTSLALLTTSLWAQSPCEPYGQTELLHTNHQKVSFNSRGTAFYDNTMQLHHIPYSAGSQHIGTVFSAAPWVMAEDTAGTVMGQMPTYIDNGGGYGFGPIDEAIGAPYALDDCHQYNHIWRVSRSSVEQLIADYNNNGMVDDPVSPQLLKWPGRGNPHFSGQMGYSLPDQDMAPFYDQNNDGIYDPMQGDYPVYKEGVPTAIAEELLWTVFHTRTMNINPPNLGERMNLEIQQTAYALDCGSNEILNKSLFIKHRLINRGDEHLQNVRYGNWNDFDLGNFTDDYVGSVPSKNTIYAYNMDMFDDTGHVSSNGYGDNPPVQAVTFLNETMASASYSVNINNNQVGQPTTMQGYQNVMNGLFLNGVPMTTGGDGYDPNSTAPAVKFMFPDDPNDPTGWSMASATLFGLDQRTLGVVARNELRIGESWDIDLVYSFHRGTGPHSLWSNVTLMYQQLDSLQQYYDNGLENLSCPISSSCLVNCVYPGDANNNGIANDFDILEMGLHYGQTAVPRTQTGDRWFAYTPPTPATNAYVDANGLGVVDTSDLMANTQNWGFTHSLYTGAAEGSNAQGTDLYFKRVVLTPVLTSDTLVPLGGRLRVDPHLWDTSNTRAIQGLTYRIAYDEHVLERASLPVSLQGGWLKDDQATVYHRRTLEPGLDHIVTSRLDNGNYTGGGRLDYVYFRVKPTAPVTSDTMYTQICFEDFKAVRADGTTIPLGAECITIAFEDPNYNSVRQLAAAPPIYIYPNPAQEAVQVDLGQAFAKEITLMDVTGRPLQQLTNQQGQVTIKRGDIPTGVYLIRVAFDNGSQSTHKVLFQ